MTAPYFALAFLFLTLACARTSTNAGEQPAEHGGAPFEPAEAGAATNGGVTNGGVTNGGVTNGGVTNGGVTNGGVTTDGGDAGTPPGGGGAGEEEPTPRRCEPIVFDDAELEHEVRGMLQKPSGPLTSSDVAAIEALAALNVTSLRGVECFANLRTLDLIGPGSRIADLSPLAGLNELYAVALESVPIASLAPLGTLPKLEQLYLFRVATQVDLAPLASAPALQLLYLHDVDVLDLAPLGTVPTLTYLDISGGVLRRPESIAAVTSLTALNAPRVFSDVSPLAKLTSLVRLRVAHGPIQNFAALSALTRLQYLDVSETRIDSLEPLSPLVDLVSVDAGGNRLRDLTPLARLSQLSRIILIDNLIEDIAPLDNPALAAGDFVFLTRNPLSCDAQGPHLASLSARGVMVWSDCP